MRVRIIALICIGLLVCSVVPACAESAATDIVTPQEWSWDPATVNNFTGSIDLSAYAGTELTVRISAEVEPNTELGDNNRPVFTILNGKRVRMAMQTDTAVFTPDAEQPELAFSGTIRMPEKTRLKKVRLTVTALKGTEEVKSVSGTVGLGGGSDGQGSGAFYIPYDIGTITLILACAAAAVWALAILRNRLLNRKKQTGE